ncbi:hypothetical protein ABK040_004326 [Willaertia magna]
MRFLRSLGGGELLRLRTLPSVPRTQLETTEQNLWKCVNDFAVQFEQNEGSWGSAVVLTPSEEELERRSSPQIKSAIKFGANLPFVGGNTGDVFYFERYSGRTSWTRPKILETIIEEGKLGSSMESQDYEHVFDCEFLQINFLTCINSSKAKISGCTMEMDKLMRCMRAKVMQKK